MSARCRAYPFPFNAHNPDPATLSVAELQQRLADLAAGMNAAQVLALACTDRYYRLLKLELSLRSPNA